MLLLAVSLLLPPLPLLLLSSAVLLLGADVPSGAEYLRSESHGSASDAGCSRDAGRGSKAAADASTPCGGAARGAAEHAAASISITLPPWRSEACILFLQIRQSRHVSNKLPRHAATGHCAAEGRIQWSNGHPPAIHVPVKVPDSECLLHVAVNILVVLKEPPRARPQRTQLLSAYWTRATQMEAASL